MDIINERWAPIDGWNGKYFISDHGRLKSIGGKYKKKCPDGYITIGCFEKSTGYMAITMRRPGVCEKERIHVLVATYFIDKPYSEVKLFVNHKDGNKLNNHWTNFEWLTPGDNVRHAVRIGVFDTKGEKHYNAKLNRVKVIEMRSMRKAGMTYQFIADMFGVERRQASDVIRGVNWGWLKDGIS